MRFKMRLKRKMFFKCYRDSVQNLMVKKEPSSVFALKECIYCCKKFLTNLQNLETQTACEFCKLHSDLRQSSNFAKMQIAIKLYFSLNQTNT